MGQEGQKKQSGRHTCGDEKLRPSRNKQPRGGAWVRASWMAGGGRGGVWVVWTPMRGRPDLHHHPPPPPSSMSSSVFVGVGPRGRDMADSSDKWTALTPSLPPASQPQESRASSPAVWSGRLSRVDDGGAHTPTPTGDLGPAARGVVRWRRADPSRGTSDGGAAINKSKPRAPRMERRAARCACIDTNSSRQLGRRQTTGWQLETRNSCPV